MPGAVLTIDEREEISRGLVDEETFTEIAARIGRHKSAVSREVGRHGGTAGLPRLRRAAGGPGGAEAAQGP